MSAENLILRAEFGLSTLKFKSLIIMIFFKPVSAIRREEPSMAEFDDL